MRDFFELFIAMILGVVLIILLPFLLINDAKAVIE
jgi:hypothetical protein